MRIFTENASKNQSYESLDDMVDKQVLSPRCSMNKAGDMFLLLLLLF